jgi:hypothetical protein
MIAAETALAGSNIQSVHLTYPGGTPTLNISGTGFSGGTVNVRETRWLSVKGE